MCLSYNSIGVPCGSGVQINFHIRSTIPYIQTLSTKYMDCIGIPY